MRTWISRIWWRMRYAIAERKHWREDGTWRE